MTLHYAGLSEWLFDGGNSNYHSNEIYHTKVVGIPRAVDKVLPVSIYSNHILLTLLIELLSLFSIDLWQQQSLFVFCLFIRECTLHSNK